MLVAALVAGLYLYEPAVDDGRVSLPELPVSSAAPAAVEEEGPAGPEILTDPDGISRFAVVQARVSALAEPDPRSEVVGMLARRTPEATDNIALALKQVERDGRDWVRVRLPVLPNDTTGWVPRESLGLYHEVDTRLVVSKSELRATLYRGGEEIWSAPVGIGLDKWPTPKGEFYVRNKLEAYSSPMYGPIAFGTSARSPTLTDWPAGGFVGIHGTDRPEILPGKVSHGCIRLANEDILALAQLMGPGTPLTIR
ncbi:MAG: L,D-transpeptidase family protein [Acidimicrobiia bacterium]